MRPLFAVFCLLALAACPLQAQGKKKALEIIYHGHSFFEIRSSKGTVLVIDPHAIPAYGRPMDLTADAALITHPHNDHTQIVVLENKDNVKVIQGIAGFGPKASWRKLEKNEKQVKDFKIRTLGVYHDSVEGMKFGKNTIFILDVDGWKIVHLGDLGHPLSKEQVREIGPVDVLMIPVGGIYTINGSEAKKVASQLKPKEYILPMHYGTPVFTDLLSEEEFVDGYPARQIVRTDSNRLVPNREADQNRPFIVLLHWESKRKKS